MVLQRALADRDASLARWERERSRGRTSFVWRNGVLTWGLPAAALTIAYKVFQELGALDAATLTARFSPELRIAIALCLVFFPALGHLLGQRLWIAGEERYDRMKNES